MVIRYNVRLCESIGREVVERLELIASRCGMWSGSRGLSADEAGIQATLPALPTVLLEGLLACIIERDVMGSVQLIIQMKYCHLPTVDPL